MWLLTGGVLRCTGNAGGCYHSGLQRGETERGLDGEEERHECRGAARVGGLN